MLTLEEDTAMKGAMRLIRVLTSSHVDGIEVMR